MTSPSTPPTSTPPLGPDGLPLDDEAETVREALRDFSEEPEGVVVVHRPQWASLHVLVVSSRFRGLNRAERSDLVWKSLWELDDEVKSQIAQVSPRMPGETLPPGFPCEGSAAAEEFGHEMPVFHRTSPREVWALTPKETGGDRYLAFFTTGSVPDLDRARPVEAGGTRESFETAEAAAAAAFEAAKQAGTDPIPSAAA